MASRILLADDSITIQKVVNLTFADEGIEVVTVSNGEMAQRLLGEINPDLVLADIFMPGRNGYELCQYVKESPQFRRVPVVLLVGAFEPFDQAEARRVGADGHLTKPFESRTLVETVRKLIQERKSNSGQLKNGQQAASVKPVPETRPLDAQPLELPFNIDLTPLEESGASSVSSYAFTEPLGNTEAPAPSAVSSFDEPFRVDFGSPGQGEPDAHANGGAAQPAQGAAETVGAHSGGDWVASDSMGFDFTQVDQPEPPLAADVVSFDVFTPEQTGEPGAGLPDFATAASGADSMATMEFSRGRTTGPLELPKSGNDGVGPVVWDEAVTVSHREGPDGAASLAPEVGTDHASPPQSLLGEEEPLGDVLSDAVHGEPATADAPQPDLGIHEPDPWSSSASPAHLATPPQPASAPLGEVNFDFSPAETADKLVPDSTLTADSAPASLPDSGTDFLIASDEVKEPSTSSELIVDVTAQPSDGDGGPLPFQPLSIEPEPVGHEAAQPADIVAEDLSGDPHESSGLPDVPDFRASEMWTDAEAQFSPIDIEAVPITEEAAGPEPVVSRADESSEVRPFVEPDIVAFEAAETSFEFSGPAPEDVLPEIGFDIVQASAGARIPQAETGEPVLDLEARPHEPEQEATVPENGLPANLSRSALAEIVRQVLQEMSDSVVREIAWEVVPDCVERVVEATVERLARESLTKRS